MDIKVIMKWCWKNGISLYRQPNDTGNYGIVMIKNNAHIPGKQTYSPAAVEGKMIELYTQIYEKNNKVATNHE